MEELRRILVVDDDEDLLMMTQLALESIGGYEVTGCGTAEEALELVHSFGPELVLLDVQLPGRSGTELVQELGVPVVFLTAQVRQEDRQRYLALGALDVIPKPFEPMKLAEQVRLIWQRSG